MDAAERNRKGDREIMALTARELEMRQLQRQREQNAWNKETRIQRMEGEIADGSARHGIHAIQQQKEAVDYLRGGGIAGLRAHELATLKQQGENEFKVAKQKRLGMREQGADAAGRNAEATKYGWDKQLEVEQERQKGGLTLAEKQIASQERIAGMEHGTIGPDGTVTPGSRERVAGINADAVAQQAELKRQHELEIEREKTQRNTDTNQTRVQVGAGHDQARRDAAGLQQQRADNNAASRVDQDVMQGKYLQSGMTPEKWKTMSEEERSAFRKSVGVGQGTGGNQPPARRSWRDRYEQK